MSKPALYIFSISHYCEKARWALDYIGIDYQLEILAPGAHVMRARQLGAKHTSLPILKVGDSLIQGSSEIIDWAEENGGTNQRTLQPTEQLRSSREMEKRLDEKIGIHLRRMFYSEALVEHPHTVKSVFANSQSLVGRLKLTMAWSMIRSSMIRRMDLGRTQGDESRDVLEQEFDWLDGVLQDGREFLIGDRLSRVDITAASLMARLVSPDEYPSDDGFKLPPRARESVRAWIERPCLQWVLTTYRKYR